MKRRSLPRTMRRSLRLPRALVEKATAVAPRELRQNLNRLVIAALQEYAASQSERAFEDAMARMAADPTIRAECAAISRASAAGL